MIVPVLVIGAWVVAVAVALRTNHQLNSIPKPAPPEVLPDAPARVWTQDRVDAQFRAMTAPLCR